MYRLCTCMYICILYRYTKDGNFLQMHENLLLTSEMCSVPFAEFPLHFLIASKLSGKTSLAYSKPTHYQLSYASPYWATPHPTEFRRTVLSCATPYWATPHPILSYAAPYWATPHPMLSYPTELRRTQEISSPWGFLNALTSNLRWGLLIFRAYSIRAK